MSSVRVLILDDDPDDAFLIADHFDDVIGQDYEVETTGSPDEAIEFLLQDRFDIMLCDYRMGAVSGVDMLERMTRLGIATPTILMTGVGNDAIDRAAMEAGAADFVAKDELGPRGLDRAVRYAIAANERQKLLRTVLDTAGAAVLLVNEDDAVELSNTTAMEIARELSANAANDGITEDADDTGAAGTGVGMAIDSEGEMADLQHLVERAFESDARDVRLPDRILDRSVKALDDGRRLLVLHDVTERVEALEERARAERRLAHAASHDTLTALPNRDAFNTHLLETMERAMRANEEMAVLSFDLDRFKDVNDVHGHAAGDELLIGVAERLRTVMGDEHFVARLGGDEFVAIVTGREAIEAQAVDLARQVLWTLGKPFEVTGRTLFTGSSIGIAIYPHHGKDAASIVANADIAMYRAKKTPTQALCVFDEGMDAAVRSNRKLVDDLRQAIENDGFDIYMQPQATVRSRELTGYEALARWKLPDGRFVPPDVFIAVAEETGLILPLGEHLLRRSVEAAASWREGAKVAINVSPVQINHSDLPALLRSALVRYGISPAMVELEVTESALIDNSARALHALRQVRAMGVTIALDDFGTGYSSLAMLQSFPFDKIKIDKSFVTDLERSQNSAIVRSIVQLGENLDTKVLSEGVETETHVRMLAEMGCAEMQGYLIGKPFPHAMVDEFTVPLAATG